MENTPNSFFSLLDALRKQLIKNNWQMGTAESCTGGLISSICTSQPGSSVWFSGSIVSYSNHVKTKLLGVPESIINNDGAVSATVASSMAIGCLTALGVNCAIAVTGIAGPDGGTVEKPVGTVWIATAIYEEGKVSPEATCNQFFGKRSEIQFASAHKAFELLLHRIS